MDGLIDYFFNYGMASGLTKNGYLKVKPMKRLCENWYLFFFS